MESGIGNMGVLDVTWMSLCKGWGGDGATRYSGPDKGIGVFTWK